MLFYFRHKYRHFIYRKANKARPHHHHRCRHRGNVLLPVFNYSESDYYSFALHVAELLIQISSSSMHKCFM
jgi:hypothetical protein